MSIAVSIAHAGHIPERKPLLERLLGSLGTGWSSVHVESARAKPFVWSERQWRAVADTDAEYGLFLNDDLVLCDKFGETLEAVVAAQPSEIVSLYCSDSKAAHLMGRWYTSRDGLIGNAYSMSTGILREFLAFRDLALRAGSVELLSEDQQINLFAMATGRKIWHTRPSLVEHDVSVASCYGNEGNSARTSVIPPWRAMNELDWSPRKSVPHLGRFFHGNHWGLLKHIHPERWATYDCFRKFYEYHNDHVDEIRIKFGAPPQAKAAHSEWCDPMELADDDYQKRLCIERYKWACKYISLGAAVANAACGANYGTPMLMLAGAAKVVGFDSGPEQQRVSQSKGYGEFRLVDIEKMTFSEFDTLVCIETLEHLKNPRAFLENLDWRLQTLVLTTPIVPTKHLNPHHLHDFTEEQILGWLACTGWNVVSKDYQADPGWQGGTEKMSIMIHAERA